jgi:hypothetical protein
VNPWRHRWAAGVVPDRFRKLRVLAWREFQSEVERADPRFIAHFVSALMFGDAFLLKGAFSPGFVAHMRESVAAWARAREGSFHKMLDGCPDFHRQIDIETGRKYSILACKHAAYFFRWNDDPCGLWPTITERWRVLKVAMGSNAGEYESNAPSDGPTDRIQVVRYPPGVGYLEPHRDAFDNQACFISGYMSKRGVDYQGGGFYFVDAHGDPQYVEDEIDVGDICIGHANILHGVAPCDREKACDWNGADGRWFLGLYSNDSDYVQSRVTSRPVRVEVPGVLPDAAAAYADEAHRLLPSGVM